VAAAPCGWPLGVADISFGYCRDGLELGLRSIAWPIMLIQRIRNAEPEWCPWNKSVLRSDNGVAAPGIYRYLPSGC
jgi:hypothetical protein